MDNQRFDSLAKRVGTSRRSVLKKVVGIGGALAVARLGTSGAEAARRGYGGPFDPADSQAGTLAITWEYHGRTTCTALAALSGWAPNTTYRVGYSYYTVFGPRE